VHRIACRMESIQETATLIVLSAVDGCSRTAAP
jgi:hypothetical protein